MAEATSPLGGDDLTKAMRDAYGRGHAHAMKMASQPPEKTSEYDTKRDAWIRQYLARMPVAVPGGGDGEEVSGEPSGTGSREPGQQAVPALSGVDPSRVLGLPSNTLFDSLDDEGQTLVLNAMQERACEVSNYTYFDDYQQAEMFKAGLEELARQLASATEAETAETGTAETGTGSVHEGAARRETPEPSPQSSPTLKTGMTVEEGWKPADTAPTNVAVQVYCPNLDYYGNQGVYAGMLVDMGTGQRWMTFAWAMGRDMIGENRPTHWRPLPAAPESPDETALRTLQGGAAE